MTEPRPHRLSRRRTLVLACGATVVAVTGVGTTAALASTPAPAATVTTVAAQTSCPPGVGALLRALPRSLDADLKHLRAAPKAERAADRAGIKQKALSGAYGSKIERVAAIAAGEHGAATRALPAALRADLKALRADAKGSAARRAEAATIWSKAASGAYGARIASFAKTAKTRADARCAARSTSGS